MGYQEATWRAVRVFVTFALRKGFKGFLSGDNQEAAWGAVGDFVTFIWEKSSGVSDQEEYREVA